MITCPRRQKPQLHHYIQISDICVCTVSFKLVIFAIEYSLFSCDDYQFHGLHCDYIPQANLISILQQFQFSLLPLF